MDPRVVKFSGWEENFIFKLMFDCFFNCDFLMLG